MVSLHVVISSSELLKSLHNEVLQCRLWLDFLTSSILSLNAQPADFLETGRIWLDNFQLWLSSYLNICISQLLLHSRFIHITTAIALTTVPAPHALGAPHFLRSTVLLWEGVQYNRAWKCYSIFLWAYIQFLSTMLFILPLSWYSTFLKDVIQSSSEVIFNLPHRCYPIFLWDSDKSSWKVVYNPSLVVFNLPLRCFSIFLWGGIQSSCKMLFNLPQRLIFNLFWHS